MFLKKIELKGFKSFNTTTTINFPNGLIVFVGPNGSGKSNINDAFKWVMGEKSKKNLRASNSNDMIFSGSETEKASEMAEVSLVFNNENRILNIEFDEVEITRRAYRDQEFSEYFINRTLVRRKDVKNLFLDTGLGNIDLTVVSQGSVSKITEAKPEELKELLNEASGVSRYSNQKSESIRKLEKVSVNLQIFEVKLDELEKQITPLKKQREKTEIYLKLKKELDNIELSYIKENLSVWIEQKENYDLLYQSSINEKEKSSALIDQITLSINSNQEKLLLLDEKLFSLQNKQSEISQKTNSEVFENDLESIENLIKSNLKSIGEIQTLVNENKQNSKENETSLFELKENEKKLFTEKSTIEYKLNSLEYEMSRIKSSFLENLDRGTRSVLENKEAFNQVFGLVSQIIKFDPKHEIAINLTLGNKLKNIVVSNDETIKDIISFLKKNKLGSATLIPYKQVQPKNISHEVLDVLSTRLGFLGTISENIKVDSKFRNVIDHLAGNILLFDDIDNALECAKLLQYRFMIVTIDGQIIYPGFVVRGGYVENRNTNSSKESLLENIKQVQSQFDFKNNELIEISKQIDNLKQNHFLIENEIIRLNDRKNYLESNLEKYISKYESISGKKYDITLFSNDLISDTSFISYEQITQKIKTIQSEKMLVSKNILDAQKEEDVLRKQWQTSVENISKSQIELSRLSNKIDTNLVILSRDHKLTYDSLIENIQIGNLEIDIETAERKISQLRSEISKLGFINLEAIELFDSLSKEYEVLKNSTIDLRNSKDTLLSTIETMDKEMKDKLADTFIKINNSLKTTFSVLFQGGKGELKYTDQENILESGIEFIGQTPGKTVKSITLYSGGEKSLMALALLFAIADVKKLPLLMLDEVEAALDESNVDRFAKYAKIVNDNNTQIIITTHRPGTMEIADVLYGVTMQVKGISKIVSVKLQEAIEMIN